MINRPKGTLDVLPNESYKWRIIRNVIDDLSNQYNLHEIITPIFEHTELFVRGDGESSDIVNKEMYTFNDKGDRSLTLKPEGTASVARCFIENGLFNEPLPLKTYYITPCFRYERPQAGRYRQHTQFGVEIFGPNTVSSDVEAILIATDFYKALGINPTVIINNLGCPDCRKNYIDSLKLYASKHLDDLCPDCKRRINQNPLRLLDCKVDSCKKIFERAPLISEHLCETCTEQFNQLKKMLTSLNIKYKVDAKLVRGLDYYTDLVFEIIDEDKTLGQNALGGGGRYNKLVEKLDGKPTPVIGFGIGIERVLLYLESKNIILKDDRQLDCYIASATLDELFLLKLAKSLRSKGISVEIDLMMRSVKSQFKYANKINSKFVITIGDSEIKENKATIKDMSNGAEITLWINDLADYIIKNR